MGPAAESLASSPSARFKRLGCTPDHAPLKTAREVTIVNELGLHARPAAEFVRIANAFVSKISIIRQERRYSAQSMIDVMLADLRCGDSAILKRKESTRSSPSQN